VEKEFTAGFSLSKFSPRHRQWNWSRRCRSVAAKGAHAAAEKRLLGPLAYSCDLSSRLRMKFKREYEMSRTTFQQVSFIPKIIALWIALLVLPFTERTLLG